MPENDRAPRYCSGPSTVATAAAVASLAEASRLVAEYDEKLSDTYLRAAEAGQAWLDATPGAVGADQSFWPNETYGGGDESSFRAWAAVQLWRATGDASRLAEVEVALADIKSLPTAWDWSEASVLAVAGYLLEASPEREPAEVERLQGLLTASADAIQEESRSSGYGRGVHAYYWGSDGIVARTSYNLLVVEKLTGDSTYRAVAQRQLDHLLGRNYFMRSMVTGVGYRPPRMPHHRPSSADSVSAPWPGLLVGGPNDNSTDNPHLTPLMPSAAAWFDDSADYWTNEVAVNWNAALVFAAAGQLPR